MAAGRIAGRGLGAILLLLQGASLAWLPPRHHFTPPRFSLSKTCPQQRGACFGSILSRRRVVLDVMSEGNKQVVGGKISTGDRVSPQEQQEEHDRMPPRLKEYDDLKDLLAVLQEFYDSVDVNGREAATAMNHLKRLQGQAKTESQSDAVESIMKKFSMIALKEVETLDAKSAALAINALGQGRGKKRVSLLLDFVRPLLSRLHGNPDGFSSRALAMVMNAFARNKIFPGNTRLQHADKDVSLSKDVADLYQTSSRLMQEKFHADADTFSWSMLLNAYACANLFDSQLLQLASNELVMKKDAPSPQDLANIVNAYHRFGVDDGAIYDWSRSQILAISPKRFSIQEITSIWTAYSFQLEKMQVGSRLGNNEVAQKVQLVCTHMAEAAMLLPANRWTKQGASLIMNALSREWIGNEKLKLQILSKTSEILCNEDGFWNLKAQDVGLILNGLARLNHTDSTLVSRLEKAAVGLKQGDWSAMDIVNVVDALDRLKLHNNTDLVKYMEKAVLQSPMGFFSARSLCSLIYASSGKLQWSSIGLFALGLTRGEWKTSSHSVLYQRLLEIVQNTSFKHVDWQTLVRLVDVERKHRHNTVMNSKKEDIEHLVMSALRGFEGAGMLSSVSDILCREERIAGEAEPLMLGKLAFAISTAPEGVFSSYQVEEVLVILRKFILALPVNKFGGEAISLILRAFQRAGCLDLALFRRMSWAFRQTEHVSIREAVVMARALSEVKQRDSELSIFLSRFIRAQDSSAFTTDELAILVSSFSRKSVLDGSLYRFFAGCILQHSLSDFSAQNVATILHGYSKAGIWQEEEAGLISEAFSHAETRKRGRGDRRLRDGAIFRHISQSLVLNPRSSESRNCADIMNAYVRAGVWDEDLFARLSQVVMSLRARDIPVSDIAVIVNAFSKATTRSGSRLNVNELFLHMARIVRQKSATEFRARDVAEIVNALSRANTWDSGLFRHMSTVLRQMSPVEVSVRDAARIVCAFSLAWQREDPRLRDGSIFRYISACVLKALSMDENISAAPGDIAALAHAYTRAGVWDERLFRTLAGSVKKIDPALFNVKDLAEVVSSFSAIETRTGSTLRDGALFMRMGSIAKSLSFRDLVKEPRAVANLVNAFAKAGIWDEDLFRLCSRVVRSADPKGMHVNDCAAIVSSFAKAQAREGATLRDGALFRRMSLIVQVRREKSAVNASSADSFSPRSMANILSAFARAGIFDQKLFMRVAKLACGISTPSFSRDPLDAFKTQEMTSLAWALAKSADSRQGFEDSNLPVVQQYERERRGAADLSIRTFFDILSQHLRVRKRRRWRRRWESSWLFRMAESEISRRSQSESFKFNPQDMSNIAFAFSKSRYRSHQVFDILAGEILDKSQAQRYDFSAFASRQLAMLIVAYAKAGYKDSNFFQDLQKEVMSRQVIMSATVQDVVNIAWAAAMAEETCSSLSFNGQKAVWNYFRFLSLYSWVTSYLLVAT
ncbi:hypothetical protein GUITHDRAFT_142377 [Guillardia theta CCMP2712]|uniref:Uncharacterized protein n=1 Tax=Guillardia theta (strain CCMP2712) TaxID=905079 RepID=L1IYS7_GUITC|nr:hypothetical protein GUITHDRAFT_142377 [Guillardia theta CCMP2712]EKX40980.1 hypothetical protein GUITHDRAFT_142377 [Guillardia theta CCMP2712]|eukprot:XP_005827960.1 hypothetical protein GUITHDRAFT_142377 [Guillardia theta CCMP2712]